MKVYKYRCCEDDWEGDNIVEPHWDHELERWCDHHSIYELLDVAANHCQECGGPNH